MDGFLYLERKGAAVQYFFSRWNVDETDMEKTVQSQFSDTFGARKNCH